MKTLSYIVSALSFIILFFSYPSAALSANPYIHRYWPTSDNVTYSIGTTVQFSIGAEDSDADLWVADWYLETSPEKWDPWPNPVPYAESTWTHTFNSYGDYRITVYVNDHAGNQSDIFWNVSIPNHAPTGSRNNPSDYSITINQGTNQSFTVSAADQDGNLDFVEWYLGTGNFQENNSVSGTSDTDTWSHTFDTVGGPYYVYAVIYDSENEEVTVTWEVNVANTNDAPTGSRNNPSDYSITINQGTNQSFTVNAADQDGNLDFVEWYLGTGNFQENNSVSGSSDTDTWSHTFDTVGGPYYVYAVIYDSENEEVTVAWEVNVANTSHAPTASRNTPSEFSTTVPVGTNQSFTVNAGDQDGNLSYIDWWLDGNWVHHDISGFSTTDTWSYTFTSDGTYYVHAYVYDTDDTESDPQATWEIVVGEQPPVQNQFFDDFSYVSSTDPELANHIWTVTHGDSGPPGDDTEFSRDNINFHDEDGGRIMSLSASTTGTYSSLSQAHIGTTERIFLEGTYTARVRFTDTPIAYQDGSVQTFYAITPLSYYNDPNYSECDFEYLPYPVQNWTGLPEYHESNLYYTSWETYTPEPWWANKATSETEKSHSDWNILTFKVIGGAIVEYWVDGTKMAEHQYSDNDPAPDENTVYPETPMSIDFNHWFIAKPDNSGLGPVTNEPRIHTYDVDWVYHAKDRDLSVNTILDIVSDIRSQGISHCNTMPGYSLACGSISSGQKGDVNEDDSVDLLDLITVLQLASGSSVSEPVNLSADVNNDSKINQVEAIYILDKVSEQL